MKTLLFIGFLFFFSGCVSSQPKTGDIVKITNKCLVDQITITDIKGMKIPSGFLKTQISGTNNSDKYIVLEYKVVWLDKNGFVINSILSNWKKISAYANQPFYMTNISPNTKTDDFRLYVRTNNKEILCKK